MLQFRGNWDAEDRKYHPQGKLIFDSFAKGVNAAIQKAPIGSGARRARLLPNHASPTLTAAPRPREFTGRPPSFRLRSNRNVRSSICLAGTLKG